MIAGTALALAAIGTPAQGEPCPPEVVEAPREYAGIYLDQFEAQKFVEGATGADEARRRSSTGLPWLTFDVVGLGERFGVRTRVPSTAYRVRFLGERRTRGTDRIPCGYGHFNMSIAEIRLIELRAIEPLGR